MKILLDENTSSTLANLLDTHEVHHVVDLGWDSLKNGALMSAAATSNFEIFITADKNMRFQQNVAKYPFSLVVLDVHPCTPATQRQCVEQIQKLIPSAQAGTVYVIEGPHAKRLQR